MQLYLAAAWARKDEIFAVSQQLEQLPGVTVQARWLYEPVPAEYTNAFRRERAQHDVDDVTSADILVRFTDDLSGETVPAKLATGARMFEMGLAYALGKPIIVVGGIQPIFDHLPSIIHVENIAQLENKLSEIEALATEYRGGVCVS